MQNRLTVVEMVYHQIDGMQPTSYSFRYSRELDSPEQTWIRRIRVSEELQKVDLGWITEPSMLEIQSLKPEYPVMLSEEELKDESRKVIEVIFGEAVFFLGLGESMRVRPKNSSDITIRSQYGNVSCLVYAFPS